MPLIDQADLEGGGRMYRTHHVVAAARVKKSGFVEAAGMAAEAGDYLIRFGGEVHVVPADDFEAYYWRARKAEPVCVRCGCTQDDAEGCGGGCSWAKHTNQGAVCSACLDPEFGPERGR